MAEINPKKLDDKAYDWLFHKLESAMYWRKPPHLQWRYDQDGDFQVYTAPDMVEGRPKHLTTIYDPITMIQAIYKRFGLTHFSKI